MAVVLFFIVHDTETSHFIIIILSILHIINLEDIKYFGLLEKMAFFVCLLASSSSYSIMILRVMSMSCQATHTCVCYLVLVL
ncbi:hypothetical protein B0T13DRAFT_455213 [Neurospora crassa]|nr:hypothetical protein B0T13DRAFT_455213 [Neurospora crassa]